MCMYATDTIMPVRLYVSVLLFDNEYNEYRVLKKIKNW